MLAIIRKIRCLRISFGEGNEILNSKMRRESILRKIKLVLKCSGPKSGQQSMSSHNIKS